MSRHAPAEDAKSHAGRDGAGRPTGPNESPAPAEPPLEVAAQVLAFRAGPWRFVVDVHRIVGVLGSHGVAGAKVGRQDLDYMGWQGEAVPVFALAALLGPPANQSATAPLPPGQGRVLLLRTSRGLAGLRIEEAEQVVRLQPEACLRTDASSAPPSDWCLGFCRLHDDLYGLFDVRALAAHLPQR